ncbi:MAG: TRAP transporter small permease subunit [Paracoccus sp. (in: a-proteobacteria)]|uniref:TRAP transporter small permease n=1 Tax=Paracoccus sp. TaxID=267 RepID=UPI0026E0C657|nr:TRAP transporter small permease subunit [Paracoccus sp. (in: a-proteobacteria)]MDO5630214.1 TRAP transporter small permease subunit [Paracoccus sp. (in: a-proteobacteria)]
MTGAPHSETAEVGRVAPAILRGIISALDLSGRLICVVTLVVLFLGLLANVVLRYVYGQGLGWAYEIHAILLPWMIAGGVVIATVYSRNIAITILPDLLTPERQRLLFIIVSALTLLISVFVVWSAFPIIRAAQYQRISALGGISQWWGYASLIYGFGSMAVICACDIIAALMGRVLRNVETASSLS